MLMRTALRRALPPRGVSCALRLRSTRRYSVDELANARKQEAKVAAATVLSWVDGYAALVAAYPLRVNAAVSGALCAIGDVLAQCIEIRLGVAPDDAYDAPRTARMLTYGVAICGPLLYGWYSTLHLLSEAVRVSHVPLVGSRVGALLPWLGSLQQEVSGGLSPVRLLIAKVVADGLFFQAPFLNLYFMTMGALEGRGPYEIYEKTKAAFHRAWGLSLLVWTPVQLLNLSLVPHAMQPAVVATVNVGWKATLSLLNAMHHRHQMHESQGTDGTLSRRMSSELEALRAENAFLREEVVALWEDAEQARAALAAQKRLAETAPQKTVPGSGPTGTRP